ncbi:MAG: YfjI family protein [Longimicrobiales bacterium]|nr:YfjI family protein [Longimicrobiales bacterium]
MNVLPPALAAHVESVAAALQVPRELPELLALACVSAAVAGRVEVEPRAGWREPVGIYTATILPPGSRKSPTYAALTEPLRDFEAESIHQATPRYLSARDAVDVALADLEGTKRAAARSKATRDEVEAARLRVSEAEAAMPPDGRLLVGDVTPEALVQRLAAQGGRAAVLEPEPGPLQMVAGRYSNTARLGEVNKAWSAEDITVDRVGRPPVFVRRPALTLAVLLQPDVLENLPNGRALRAEGTVGRVLWCRPPHGLGRRLTGANVPALDDVARARYSRVLRVLLDLAPAGATEDGTPRPHVLRLEPEALKVLHAYEEEAERDLADGGRYASIRDWFGKAVGQALRVAALLELAARAGDGRPLVADIGPSSMSGAVRLVRALASHALAVLHGLGVDARRTEALLYLVRRLQELPEGTTENELRDSARRHRYIENADDVAELLDELEERGCVRRVPRPRQPGPGRAPSPALSLHPLLCGDYRPPENIP